VIGAVSLRGRPVAVPPAMARRHAVAVDVVSAAAAAYAIDGPASVSIANTPGTNR